jgi:hypothetical protein
MMPRNCSFVTFYVLENASMLGLVKIGRTERSVSDPSKAILALRWVVNEMEKRFQFFLRVGVTNIASFNSCPKNKPLPEQEGELSLPTKPKSESSAVEVDEEIIVPRDEDIVIPEKLSYVVVIIENLEALMQTAKADVEVALEHLTQNGRAAGIHFVLITRQANQNIISESIKADYTTPVEQPPIIQPHLVVCVCEHCSERIEFDANELGDRQSVFVSCPYCGVETILSPPSK